MSGKCECITCKQGNEEKFTQLEGNMVECDYCGDWMLKEKDGFRKPTIEEVTNCIIGEYTKKFGTPRNEKEKEDMKEAITTKVYEKLDKDNKVKAYISEKVAQNRATLFVFMAFPTRFERAPLP